MHAVEGREDSRGASGEARARTVRVELHVAKQRVGGVLVRDDVHRECAALRELSFERAIDHPAVAAVVRAEHVCVGEHIQHRGSVRIDEEPARDLRCLGHRAGRSERRGKDNGWRRRHDLLPRGHALGPLPQEHLTFRKRFAIAVHDVAEVKNRRAMSTGRLNDGGVEHR